MGTVSDHKAAVRATRALCGWFCQTCLLSNPVLRDLEWVWPGVNTFLLWHCIFGGLLRCVCVLVVDSDGSELSVLRVEGTVLQLVQHKHSHGAFPACIRTGRRIVTQFTDPLSEIHCCFENCQQRLGPRFSCVNLHALSLSSSQLFRMWTWVPKSSGGHER